MGKYTLSKRQYKQYEEIKDAFIENNVISISDEENVRLYEVLILLSTLGYIRNISDDYGYRCKNVYRIVGRFEDFEAWHKDKQKEERQLSRREWKIGLIGAGIGLIPFIFTTVIPWIISLFSNNT